MDAVAVAGEVRVTWNWSRRVSVVDVMTENCWAILEVVVGLTTASCIGCPSEGCGFGGGVVREILSGY